MNLHNFRKFYIDFGVFIIFFFLDCFILALTLGKPEFLSNNSTQLKMNDMSFTFGSKHKLFSYFLLHFSESSKTRYLEHLVLEGNIKTNRAITCGQHSYRHRSRGL